MFNLVIGFVYETEKHKKKVEDLTSRSQIQTGDIEKRFVQILIFIPNFQHCL